MSEALHPAAPHHLPGFITAPGDTDILMIAVGIFLLVAVLAVGNFYLHLHTLPERMAHRTHKMQFEIVAVLGLLALFTHNHLFWVIGLMLALIDLPDFLTPLRNIAASVGKIAGDTANATPGETAVAMPGDGTAPPAAAAPTAATPAVAAAPVTAKTEPANGKAELANREVPSHA